MTRTGTCAAGYVLIRESLATRRLTTLPVSDTGREPKIRGNITMAGLGRLSGKACCNKEAPCLPTNENMATRPHRRCPYTVAVLSWLANRIQLVRRPTSPLSWYRHLDVESTLELQLSGARLPFHMSPGSLFACIRSTLFRKKRHLGCTVGIAAAIQFPCMLSRPARNKHRPFAGEPAQQR